MFINNTIIIHYIKQILYFVSIVSMGAIGYSRSICPIFFLYA